MSIVKVINKEIHSDQDMAVKYYTILFGLNGIHLTPKEIQLLSFIANKGYINDTDAKLEFVRKYSSTKNTVNLMVSHLKKLGLLTRKDGQLKVIEALDVNFTTTIILNIKLTNVL